MGLEEIVSSRHIWRGRSGNGKQAVVSTGFSVLDRALPGGGWPWGAVIEIFAEHDGVGELSLWMPALASLNSGSDAGARWIVFIAPPWVPYAPALASHGIDLERVLLVGSSETATDALWAAEQSVRSGSSAAVLAWLHAANDTALRRLQLAAEECACGLMLFRPLAAMKLRSPAAMRLHVTRQGAGFRVEILKCRGGRPMRVDLACPSGTAL
ncbi:MAG TPA: translesion DNA synthesis-associated protein ImuA [Gammaproteobacteria bacterium]|nr:translesion DNA synthesis-associated protein ImuA [Gammaproteobacteria bacterium]